MTKPESRDCERVYKREFALKYGCNPQQQPALVSSIAGSKLPFTVLSGNPGYINLLDALNAWQLVSELRNSLGVSAAASFKHVSPAGAAVASESDVLSATLSSAYEVAAGTSLTPPALAYIRARNADPKSSFGDFAALSDVVDEATAKVLQKEVSDGIIAPGFDEAALQILKKKKAGKYVILQADPSYCPPEIEHREVFGVVFSQKRNDTLITPDSMKDVVTKNKQLTPEALRDLVLASITLKYTQSNSVAYALNGQVIGVGAGQQSRVDCVKLAGRKAEVWYLRQHPKVLNLKFRAGLKRVQRLNGRITYIEGDLTVPERTEWLKLFDEEPPAFTQEEKEQFLAQLKGVSLASDAFFPFRDNIDQAWKRGVSYIAQAGGSVQDSAVIGAADEYNMAMAFTSVRLFHH